MFCNTCSSVGIEPLKIALPNDIQEILAGGEKKEEIRKLYNLGAHQLLANCYEAKDELMIR